MKLVDRFGDNTMAILKLNPEINNLMNSKTKNQIYNIVNDYAWTLSPSFTRIDAPYIELREYEQSTCTLWAQLSRFIYSVKQPDNANVYKDLYFSKPTGTIFYLPYFEPYNHMISQSWTESKGMYDYSLIEKASQVYVNYQKMRQTAVGANINLPRMWSGSQAITYTVNFHLFNTTGNAKDIKDNQTFKDRLVMSTLHDQRGIILASPPALFEVVIPGIRACPAAVISQLSINNIGQMNMIDKKIVPDAWEFNITIQELLTESRQIYDASMKDNLEPVRAQNMQTKSLADTKKDATAAAKDVLGISPTPQIDPVVNAFNFKPS